MSFDLVRSKSTVLALACSALMFGATLAHGAPPASNVAQSRVVVAYKAGAGAMARAYVASVGGRVVIDLEEINAFAVIVPKAAVALLQKNANVNFVEPDGVMKALGGRGSPGVRSVNASGEVVPYGISMVQADQLPDTFASNRKLCIIDSGYQTAHEDLAGNTADGVNLTSPASGEWFTDELGHGTHVGGTVSAVGGNGIGVVGVMPGKQISLYIAKVFDASGSTPTSTVLKAALLCRKHGANVVSMSLGGTDNPRSQQLVFALLAKQGVLSIAAAGNTGDSTVSYPAGLKSVMSVAAVDSQMNWASFSSFNNDVEISGPGVNVYSTVPMGTGSESVVTVGDSSYQAIPMVGTPALIATAPLYNFGLGTAVDPGAAGMVCLIQRGQIKFADKVLNCQNSGGLGAIIYNNVPGPLFGTLGGVETAIPSVGVSDTDGAAMLGQIGQTATVNTVNIIHTNYAYYSGTSMATPHVSAVAALVWSYFPNCSADSIRNALNASALDIGDPGWDPKTGNGLVQAKAAYDYLNTNGCP